ncbi:hypothetical protein K9N08_00705 [Candidatus Gracilibacteria bacterium]|nr:hypothetical protein [Candidatus Gracilibacteria bacterium]MCF7856063.1 hypothetical protein [Candidatus Gracilibacteria bacterium]MCF7896382.1 hypothetical protein [Candidatus Gracilibacteria bacterium]
MHSEISQKLKKARGVSGFTYADFERISVIPTYQLNPEIAPKLKSKFSEKFRSELKIENFHWAVERISNLQKLRSITFGGGEPTLWKHVDEALYYLRGKGVRSTLRSNGILPPKKSLPDRVVVNLHVYFDYPELRTNIERTIRFYRENRVPVKLAFYIRENEAADNQKIAKTLAEKTKAILSTSPSYSHADLMCDNCPFTNLTIQPDGNTISLCRFLPLTAQLTDHLDLRAMYEKELLPKLLKQQACFSRQKNN